MAVPQVRITKKQRIFELFNDNIGKPFNSYVLHGTFGSAFRTRVSDINLDPSSRITIKNKTESSDTSEVSIYWSEPRKAETNEQHVVN